MLRIIIILFIILIIFYISLKFAPKVKLFVKKIIKSPFIFIIIRNLIKFIIRRF